MDYYSNSNNQNTNQYPQNNHPNGFAIASMICGILSVIACCTGILSIPFGALGIIFAVLTRRHGKSMSTMSIAGIWLSCVGMALGVLITIYSFFTLFTNPAMLEEFNSMFQMMYGVTFEEYFDFILNQ